MRSNVETDLKATHFCPHCGLTMKPNESLECSVRGGGFCCEAREVRRGSPQKKRTFRREEYDRLVAQAPKEATHMDPLTKACMYVIDSQKRVGENRQATIAQSDDQAQRRQEEESRRLELWASFVSEFCQEMAGAIVFWTAKMEGSPCRLTQGEEDPLSWRYSDLSVERTIALRGGPATSYAFTGHFQTAENGYRGEDSVESFRIVKDSSESPVVLVMRGTVFEGVNLTVRALVCWLITGGGAKYLVQWSPA